jgi:hypothetical protein
MIEKNGFMLFLQKNLLMIFQIILVEALVYGVTGMIE